MANETVLGKFKEKQSAGKVLAIIFWDCKGILLLKYCLKRSAVTFASYFDTLIRSQKAVKSKHPCLLKQKVIHLHDNATPHSAKPTQSLLNQLKWDVFCHLAGLPDLSLSDYVTLSPA